MRRKGRGPVKAATEGPALPRVVGYTRVSTEGQFSDGHGIEAQVRAIRAFAESQGFELVEIVTDCVSGAIEPALRPGFARLLKLAEQAAFGVLLLYKFDRLARNVVHAVNTVHDLRDRFGIVARSVTEPIDTGTPMGEMIFTVLASMAAQERQVIAERTTGGRRIKASKGGLACGAAPFGYRAEGKELVVFEEEAAIVRRIYEMRKDGVLLKGIADQLNAEGIRGRRGGIWRKGSIHYILDNPRYRGLAEYLFSFGGEQQHVLIDGAHSAIIGRKA